MTSPHYLANQHLDTPSIALIIFDWAGTTVDHGSFAPISAMQTAFSESGIDVTVDQLRKPMGLHKLDHIKAVLQMPEVTQLWRRKHQRDPNDGDAEAIYDRFLPLQKETAIECSDIIDGVLETVAELRERGIRIGTTTGYPRAIGEAVAEKAAKAGYVPDVCLFADDTPAARPAPWMIHQIMRDLGVYPASRVVKVGDTQPDIEEGLNAGCWSIGVTRTGSELAMSAAEVDSLESNERQSQLATIGERFLAAGAHTVIESVNDLPVVIDDINNRLANGTRP